MAEGSPLSSPLSSPVYSWLRIATLAVLAIALVWLVLSKSLVAWLVRAHPETAVATGPDHAGAQLWLANENIKKILHGPGAKPSSTRHPAPRLQETRKETAVLARKILQAEPLTPSALRILGQLADKTKSAAKNKTQAAQLMTSATRLSIRESAAVFWLFLESYRKNSHDKALYYSDILLRTRSKLDQYIFPVMMQIARSPEGRKNIEKILVQNPPWRLRFFRSVHKNGLADITVPLRLLVSLKGSKTPPTAQEIKTCLDFLINRSRYNQAYYSWLQLLPEKQLETAGFLFNGSFEYQPDGYPFNWKLPGTSKATVALYPRADQKGNALSVEFGYGHGRFGAVSQMIMLSPGAYLLKGVVKGRFRGRRGLRWRILCLDGQKRSGAGKGKMFLGIVRRWKTFEIAFTVPKKRCAAQQVQLVLDARTTSEKLVSGHVWYDELAITRASQAR